MKTGIGVLITYFNEGEMLRECIESLLAGRERPDEILVHDDASEDPASDHIPGGSKVSVIRSQVNVGPSAARNRLLRASRTPYIHFHDADDLFEPAWCERVRRAFEAERTDAMFTEVASYDGERLRSSNVLGLSRLAQDGDLVRFCIRGSMLVPAGTFTRKSVLEVGGYRIRLWQSEDYEFHARWSASGFRFSTILEPLVRIRIRAASRSHNRKEVWRCAATAVAILSTEISKEYSEELAQAAARIGSVLYQLGDREGASMAFKLGRRLSPQVFKGQRWSYRILAKTFGPEVAEEVGCCYRRWLPERLRRWLKDDSRARCR